MAKRDNKRFADSERKTAPKRSGKNRRDYADSKKQGTRSSAGGRGQYGAPSRKGQYAGRGNDKFKQYDDRFDSFGKFDEGGLEIVAGRNPVLEALRGEREVERIFIANGAEGSIAQIKAIAKEQGVVIDYVDRERINAMAPGERHQGVVAKVSEFKYSSMDEVIAKAEASGEDPFLIILDEVSDPHNLGAIIRTAECAGAHGVIIPKRRACSLTQTVAKSAAGAIEVMPVVQVTNISRTIDELKELGLWIAAVDMDGKNYNKMSLGGPIGIVIGNEGKGISRLVKEKCDFTVAIPMRGTINSLNASNAAAIIMYAIRSARDAK